MTPRPTYAALKRDIEAYNALAKAFNKARKAKVSLAKRDTAAGKKANNDLKSKYNAAIKAYKKAEATTRAYNGN